VDAFPGEPQRHRLKREIISTVLTNSIVNLAGPTFVLRTREVTGLSAADAARGFVLADGAFALSALKARIDDLDGRVDAAVQTRLYSDIADQARRAARWFLAHLRADAPLAENAARYRAGIEALRQSYQLTSQDKTGISNLTKAGVPEDLAREMALLGPLGAGLEVALLAQDTGQDVTRAAELYFALGATLGLSRLRNLAEKFHPAEHWDRLALRRLMDGLAQSQRAIAAQLLASGQSVAAWSASQPEALERVRGFLAGLEGGGELSVAKLMLASSQIQTLA
jgi:glutamate dehydrogenase